jgi:hypothetical protein
MVFFNENPSWFPSSTSKKCGSSLKAGGIRLKNFGTDHPALQLKLTEQAAKDW